MHDLLDQDVTLYLEATQDSQLVELLTEARACLVQAGYTLVEANLFKAMPEYNSLNDNFTAKMLIQQAIREGLVEALNLFGIVTTVDKISHLTQLLSLIGLLEDSTQHEEIIAIIDEDEFTIDQTLEELFCLVSMEINFDHILDFTSIREDNPFFERLKMIHSTALVNLSGEPTTVRPNRLLMDAVAKYIRAQPNGYAPRLYKRRAILFGEDLRHYIAENRDVLESYYPRDAELAVEALVGLAIFAGVSIPTLQTEVRTASQSLYGDMKFRMEFNHHLETAYGVLNSEQYKQA